MRPRTEQKRQEIVGIAIEVFREVGYERASMSTIARRLGGSKGTLYGYFQSKDELFETAMKRAVEAPGEQIESLLTVDEPDLRATLSRWASAYLDFLLGKEVLDTIRVAVNGGDKTPLGPHLFEQGPRRANNVLSAFFEKLIEQGRLRKASPLIAAIQFKALASAASDPGRNASPARRT